MLLKRFLILINNEKGRGLKILSPEQMLQRLQKPLGLVKAGNTTENSLNEFCQIIFSEEIIKKVYNNIMNSIKS